MNSPFRVSSAWVKPRAVMTESSTSGTGFGTESPVVAPITGGSVTVARAGEGARLATRKPRTEVPAAAKARDRDDEMVMERSLMCMKGPPGGPKNYHG